MPKEVRAFDHAIDLHYTFQREVNTDIFQLSADRNYVLFQYDVRQVGTREEVCLKKNNICADHE